MNQPRQPVSLESCDNDPQHKVLIADDNANHLRIIRTLLEADGFVVQEACNGEIALSIFESWKPNLVVLDSMLPQKCGLECLHLMKHHPRLSHIPVVMCSAKTDIMYALKCMETGAGGFISKPFEARTLVKRIRNLLLK